MHVQVDNAIVVQLVYDMEYLLCGKGVLDFFVVVGKTIFAPEITLGVDRQDCKDRPFVYAELEHEQAAKHSQAFNPFIEELDSFYHL